MTFAQRRNLVVFAVVIAVVLIGLAGWARGNSGYTCGELIDAINAQSYEDHGRAASKTELELASRSPACSGNDVDEAEMYDLVR